jgi:D-beta-D-heptose 7-phosphate kinase/D-beta-D-heptose 1-phosphate adenosyltransferase
MSDQTLPRLVAAMRGRRVLVVGDLILDEFVWGSTRRISPEAPVPVVEVQSRTYCPGGAANVCANVASLGGVPMLAGVVGHDAAGERLSRELAGRGIDTDGVLATSDRPTTTKTRIIARSQQVLRIDCENRQSLPPSLEEEFLRYVDARLPEVHACVVSDYAKGVVSERLAQGAITRSRQLGIPVVVDPKSTDFSIYRRASVVKPNLHELESVLHQAIDDEPALVRAGRQLSDLLEGSEVLVTRGPQGMLLFQSGRPPQSFPTQARSVFDVTGAGDTVVATLALALAAGATLEQAAHLANLAGGISVGKLGTATVSDEELLHELRELER